MPTGDPFFFIIHSRWSTYPPQQQELTVSSLCGHDVDVTEPQISIKMGIPMLTHRGVRNKISLQSYFFYYHWKNMEVPLDFFLSPWIRSDAATMEAYQHVLTSKNIINIIP